MTLKEELGRATSRVNVATDFMRDAAVEMMAASRSLKGMRALLEAEQQAAVEKPKCGVRDYGTEWLEAEEAKDRLSQEPPPIEVDMQVRCTSSGVYSWDAWLGGLRIGEVGDVCMGLLTESILRQKGITWLAALSKQLGVKLKAKWEGEEPAKTEADMRTCEGCGREFDHNLPCWGNGVLCSRECAVKRGVRAGAEKPTPEPDM